MKKALIVKQNTMWPYLVHNPATRSKEIDHCRHQMRQPYTEMSMKNTAEGGKTKYGS